MCTQEKGEACPPTPSAAWPRSRLPEQGTRPDRYAAYETYAVAQASAGAPQSVTT